MLAWLSVWGEMQICICAADATATHCLLLQEIQISFTFLVLPFWYRLTLVFPDTVQKSRKMIVCIWLELTHSGVYESTCSTFPRCDLVDEERMRQVRHFEVVVRENLQQLSPKLLFENTWRKCYLFLMWIPEKTTRYPHPVLYT